MKKFILTLLLLCLIPFFDLFAQVAEVKIDTVTGKNIHKDYLIAGDTLSLRRQTYYWNGSAFIADFSLGTGLFALTNNSARNSSAYGYYALNENTGQESNAFGSYALASNTGIQVNGFGGHAGEYNTALYANAFGHLALRYNTGLASNGFGNFALYANTGVISNAYGYDAMSRNTGGASNGFGNDVLHNNTGDDSNGFGYRALYSNTGVGASGFGSNTLEWNQGNYNIAFGYKAFNNFTDDTLNAKTFDNTDVTIIQGGLSEIYISSHSFGSVNDVINLRFTQGTSTLPGLTDDVVYTYKVIHADTIKEGVYNNNAISSIGTGTGHKFTPQIIYENSIAIGNNAEPNASNQIVLGSTTTETLVTNAGINAVRDTSSTDAYKVVMPQIGAYVFGLTITFKTLTANDGIASLTINSLPPIPIKKRNNKKLITGDIEAGQMVMVSFDDNHFQMLSPLATPEHYIPALDYNITDLEYWTSIWASTIFVNDTLTLTGAAAFWAAWQANLIGTEGDEYTIEFDIKLVSATLYANQLWVFRGQGAGLTKTQVISSTNDMPAVGNTYHYSNSFTVNSTDPQKNDLVIEGNADGAVILVYNMAVYKTN